MTDPNPDLPDEFAFWRGLAFGLCITGPAILIALCGGVWFAFKGPF